MVCFRTVLKQCVFQPKISLTLQYIMLLRNNNTVAIRETDTIARLILMLQDQASIDDAAKFHVLIKVI